MMGLCNSCFGKKYLGRSPPEADCYLEADAEKLIDKRLAGLPEYTEPADRSLPVALGKSVAGLKQMIERIYRALAFADWRKTASEPLKAFLQAVRRGDDGDADGPAGLCRGFQPVGRVD